LGNQPQKDRIRVGEEVVLFGPQGDGFIRVDDIAEQLDTIPYEVTCWISSRVKRKYTFHGKEMFEAD